MAKRRPITGKSLLAASASVVLVGCATSGSTGAVSGNLVAPPMYELCVTVEPESADVTVNGQALEDDGCNGTYEGTATVAATAVGFEPFTEDVQVTDDTAFDIVMTAEAKR